MFLAASTAWGQPAATPIISTWTVAGADVVLPNPDGDFSEVDDQLRTIFEVVVPSSDWLLTLYLSHNAKQDLLDRSKPHGADALGFYASVYEPRSARFARMDARTFDYVTAGVQSAVGRPGLLQKAGASEQDEINARLKALGIGSFTQTNFHLYSMPFSKPNASAFEVLGDIKGPRDAQPVTLACAVALMRVKGRVLFVSMCQPYTAQEVLPFLGKSLDIWTTQILQANK